MLKSHAVSSFDFLDVSMAFNLRTRRTLSSVPFKQARGLGSIEYRAMYACRHCSTSLSRYLTFVTCASYNTHSVSMRSAFSQGRHLFEVIRYVHSYYIVHFQQLSWKSGIY